MALCTPHALLRRLQDENRMTELMAIQEELKTYPFGDIWEEYCRQCHVSDDLGWMDEILRYEKEVLKKR